MSIMKISGSHHDIIRQRLGAGSVKSIETYWCGAKVYSEFERVMTGVEDFTRFINKIYEAYDRYVKNAIYDTMVGYATNLTGMFKKTGSITAANLKALCRLVSTALGCEVFIMGTRVALDNVVALYESSGAASNWYSSDMKNEKYRTGRLGMWEGYELVEIPQVFEKNKVGTYKIDDTLIFVCPKNVEKFIKLVNEGDTQITQITDKDKNRDMTYELTLVRA